MPSRHDYAREAAGRARLRFNHRHPSLSAKESHVVSFAPAEKEPDNEVKSVDPGEHHPLKRTSTSIETTKSFGVGTSEDNLNEYLELHVPNEIKCGMLYPHQIHIERAMTELTCTTTSMSTFDSGDDTKLAGEDNRDFSQNNQVQLKLYHASEANVLTANSYNNPRRMQDWTINESDKSRMISTQHIPTRNSSQHQYDQLKNTAVVKSPSESEYDTYDDEDDDYDDNDYYDSVTLMESRTHSYQRTISGRSRSKKLSLLSGIGVEVGSDFKQLSTPRNVSCSLTSVIGDVILGFTPSPTNDTTSRTSPFDTIVSIFFLQAMMSALILILIHCLLYKRTFMCNPSRVFHSGSDKFTLLDDWSVEFGSRGESDDDESMNQFG